MFFLSILHCQRNVRQLPSISVSGSMISIDLMSKTSCQMDSDHVAICRYRIYRGYGFHTPFLIASTDPVISRNHCCHCSATPWRSWWILLPLNSRRHWPTSCTAVINMICDTEAQAPKKQHPVASCSLEQNWKVSWAVLLLFGPSNEFAYATTMTAYADIAVMNTPTRSLPHKTPVQGLRKANAA